MKPPKLNIFRTLSIAIYYLAFVAVAIVICFFAVGSDSILAYAGISRPYSMLFSKDSYEELLEDTQSTRIIFFGDSNTFFPPDDPYLRPENKDIHISGLLQNELNSQSAEKEVLCVEWAFASADMFDYYCLFYLALKFSPDLIVVPVNWRSFTTLWQENPQFFHPELSAYVPLYIDQPPNVKNPVRSRGISAIRQIEYKADIVSLYIEGFKNWSADVRRSTLFGDRLSDTAPKVDLGWFRKSREPDLSTDDDQTDPVHRDADASQKIEEGSEELLQPTPNGVFQLTLPMTVSDSNPIMQEIRALAYAASDHDTRILYYIWPLDQERLARYGCLDKVALDASKRSIGAAINEWSKEEIHLVDLSYLLESEYFYDIAGHFTVEGRRKIAKALAPHIAIVLKEGNASKPAR
jgi:hypothetical protein